MLNRDSAGVRGRRKDYTPSEWSEYFAEKRDVAIDATHIFRVYLTKPDPTPDAPLIVLLHGGGFSALTWAHFSVKIIIDSHQPQIKIKIINFSG